LIAPSGEETVMARVGKLKRFLSPGEYERGRAAGVWACLYLAVTMFAIISSGPNGDGGDVLMNGLAFVATLPLSVVVLTGDGPWTLATMAGCALVNAFVFWVVVRGSAHYPRHNRTLQVPVAAGRKGRFAKHATRKELGDSLHPRKKPGEGYGGVH
jgi:hypothetical protein